MRKINNKPKIAIKAIGILVLWIFSISFGFAQITENFETETGGTTFSESGYNFSLTGGLFTVQQLADYGVGSSDWFIDTYPNQDENDIDQTYGSIVNSTNDFYAHSIYVRVTGMDGTKIGTVYIYGKLDSSTQFTSTTSVDDSNDHDWIFVDLSSYNTTKIDELEFRGLNTSAAFNFAGFAMDNFTFSIAPSNSAPTATTPSTPSVTEDDTNVALANDIQVADSDGDNQTVTFTITGGTLTTGTSGITFGGGGNCSSSFTVSGTLAAINTALDAATFTPTPNLYGTNAGTISFKSNDGTTDSNTASVTFSITGVNDDPTIANLPTDISATEDVASNVDLSATTFSDVDAGSSSITLTIAAGQGTLSASSGGGVAIGNSGTGTLSLNGTVANIDTYLNTATNIKYTSALNVNGNDATTLTLTANDGGNTGTGGGGNVVLGTINVDITAVNDAPTLTNFASVVENTTQNTEIEISLAELKAQGNEADIDGTVEAFIVKALSTGTLNIGANSGTATAFNASSNKTIDATHNAYWTPAINTYGSLNAFTTTVLDNSNAESTIEVQAKVQVNDVTKPQVSNMTISGTPPVRSTSITYVVTFNESVVNVSTDDFSLIVTGSASATIVSVSSSVGTSMNVTVNNISGSGTLKLILDASTNIADPSANTPPAAYSSGATHIVDLDNPTLYSSIPNDGASGVSASSDLTLTFSENIEFGAGNIQIIDLDDASSSVTIDATSPGTQASISNNILTLNPSSDLEESTNYAIQLAATSIDDSNGNSYAGISNNTTLNFRTADLTAPLLISNSPLDDATNVNLGENIVLNFDDNMTAGTGYVTIRRSSDNTAFEQIPIGDSKINISSNKVSINPANNFIKGETYYLEIDLTALDDDEGNSYTGISGNSTLNFTAVDVVINEVVTNPQQDWSTNGFNGIVGAGAISDGADEWIELLINSNGINLSGWTLELLDGTNVIGDLTNTGAFDVIVFSGTGSFNNTNSGDYLVLGNVDLSGAMNNTGLTINLKDPSGALVDAVVIGGAVGQAPSGNASSIYNETIQRYTNGLDTDDDSNDFTLGMASMGAANTGSSVILSVSTTSIAEAAGISTITATLSAASSQDVTVTLAVDGSSTASSSDYTLSSSSIIIAAGSTTGSATITATQDSKDENNETVIVNVSGVTNGTENGIQQKTVTITDDDNIPSISFNATSSNGSETTSSANLQVDLSAASGRTVIVNYTVSGTASGSGTDYTLANGTLTIDAGDAHDNITIASIVNDLLDENNETVIVTLSNPTNATLGTNTVHTYTINDNDATPTIAFNATSSNGSESVSSTNLQVDLSAVSGRTVNVDYTVSGTASAGGTDYTLADGTLSIAAGNVNNNITIASIVNDLLDETNETVIVTLSNPVNASLGPNTVHTYTINDNDASPVITTSQSFTIDETALNSAIVGTVLATDADAGTTFSNWTIIDGNADAVFAINSSSGVISISDNSNLDFESTNSYVLSLSVSDGSNTSAIETITINITDVDEAPILTTQSATSISSNTAILNGTVNPNSDSTAVTFEYGLTVAYGATVTADQSPINGNINTAVNKLINGLTTNTTYHYRVVGVNSSGTTVGSDMTFTTVNCIMPTSAGSIGNAQQSCMAFDPLIITSLSLPSGNTGTLEYKWQKSTTNSTTGFTDIPASNTATYDPTNITQSTWFKRLVRVNCKSDWSGALESNVIEMTIYLPFIAGNITSQQTLCYNSTPGKLTGTAPSGGLEPYTYQWQQSSDGITFVDIAGATTLNYQPPALTSSTFYQLLQTSGCGTVSTNIVKITIHDEFVAGSIGSSQIMYYRQLPEAFIGVAPTGGVAPYTYQWQQSSDGVNFTDIYGGKDLDYQAGRLSHTTYFRLKQNSSNGCGTEFTNIIIVVVFPEFMVGTIETSQEIAYGSVPENLSGTKPSGGRYPYTYQWQQSSDGVTFSDIPGETSLDYQAPALTETTYYQLIQSSAYDYASKPTNTVCITVFPEFIVGSIAEDQMVCFNSAPEPIIGTSPTGGDLPYTYQWQSSVDGITYTDVAGATALNYQPEALAAQTYFRQVQTSSSNCGSYTTNAVVISIQQQPVVDIVMDEDKICPNVNYQLEASAQNYESVTWLSSGDGIFDHVNILNPVYTPGNNDIANGKVILTIQAQALSPCEMQVLDQISLSFYHTPITDAGSDLTITRNSQVQLEAKVIGSGNYHYLWMPENLLSNSSILNPITDSISETTTFLFKVTDTETGCIIEDELVLTVEPDTVTYLVSGKIQSISLKNSLPSTQIYFTGIDQTVTTNNQGEYSMQVPSGYCGWAIPSRAGYIFEPDSIAFNYVGENIVEQNYGGELFMRAIATPDSIIPGQDVQLSIELINIDDQLVMCSWQNENGEFCTDKSTYVQPTQTTLYTVYVQDDYERSFDTVRVYVSEMTAIENLKDNNQIKVYPNPSKDIFYIEIDELDAKLISVVNTNGNLVKQFKFPKLNDKVEINLGHLIDGNYYILITNSKGEVIATEKIVKI